MFIFSTSLSVRGGGQFSPLTPARLTQVSARLAQPLDQKAIGPAGAGQASGAFHAPGCAWDGARFQVLPGTACRFQIQPGPTSRWQLNRTWQLELRLLPPAQALRARLERGNAGASPQVETLQNPPGPDLAQFPFQDPRPSPTPAPTPTPAHFTVYDPDNQGETWLLTLDSCLSAAQEVCRVELVR